MPAHKQREPSDSPVSYCEEDSFVLVDEDVDWDGDQTKYIPPTPLQDAALTVKAAAKATWENCSWDNVRQVLPTGATAEFGATLFGVRAEQRSRGWQHVEGWTRDTDGVLDGSGEVYKLGAAGEEVENVPGMKGGGVRQPMVKSREDEMVEQMLEAELEEFGIGRVFGYGIGYGGGGDNPLMKLRGRRSYREAEKRAGRVFLDDEAADSDAQDKERLQPSTQPGYSGRQTHRALCKVDDDFEPAELRVPEGLLLVDNLGGKKPE